MQLHLDNPRNYPWWSPDAPTQPRRFLVMKKDPPTQKENKQQNAYMVYVLTLVLQPFKLKFLLDQGGGVEAETE